MLGKSGAQAGLGGKLTPPPPLSYTEISQEGFLARRQRPGQSHPAALKLCWNCGAGVFLTTAHLDPGAAACLGHCISGRGMALGHSTWAHSAFAALRRGRSPQPGSEASAALEIRRRESSSSGSHLGREVVLPA